MITLNSFTQREREHLICLLRSIDADALATVFDPRDAMIADNAKAKRIVLLEGIMLGAGSEGVHLDCPEKMLYEYPCFGFIANLRLLQRRRVSSYLIYTNT